MAQDNPFLGFFESMGVGMEAGAERRSLMERARQGKLGPGNQSLVLGALFCKALPELLLLRLLVWHRINLSFRQRIRLWIIRCASGK